MIINILQLNKISTQESLSKSLMTDERNTERIVAAVPSGVDGAVGVPEAKWFVAVVNSRHEKSVAEKLQTTGIETYVATQKEMRVWANGRRKIVDRVVIPSMVFVKCTEQERRKILSFSYVNRFLVNRSAGSGGLNKPVAVIGDAEIKKLKFMLGQSDTPVEFAPTEFRINDTIRVIRGNLRGLVGEIRANSDGTHTLLVSLSLLGGATAHIQPQDVEKI